MSSASTPRARQSRLIDPGVCFVADDCSLVPAAPLCLLLALCSQPSLHQSTPTRLSWPLTTLSLDAQTTPQQRSPLSDYSDLSDVLLLAPTAAPQSQKLEALITKVEQLKAAVGVPGTLAEILGAEREQEYKVGLAAVGRWWLMRGWG